VKKLQKNKAQITLYVILGIVIIVLIGLFFLFRPQIIKPEKISQVPFELQPIKNHIDDCIKTTSLAGLSLIGAQGGHIFAKTLELETSYGNISYGYYDRKNTLPTINEMQKDISDFLELALPNCIDFSLFQNFEITAEKLKASTKIAEKEVIIEIKYPISAKTSDSEAQLKNFLYIAPVRLGHLHGIATDIITKTVNNPKWIDLTNLDDFDVDINIIPHSPDTLVYSITDNQTDLYLFLYAAKFKINKPPKLSLPDYFEIEKGKPFLYDVNVTDPENDDLVFSDNTAMFDISEEGIILFIPEVPGQFPITIRVEDEYENYDEKEVLFIIKEI